MNRHSDVDPENLTPAQQAVADAVAAGPRGSLRGPFVPWLLSPELAGKAQDLGAFLRFRSGLPDRLKELAILYTARHWDAEFEWFVHSKTALEAGVAKPVIEAIARDEKPDFANADEALIYRCCAELYETRRLSDETYAAAEKLIGQPGVAELVGILGYYVLVSLTLNVFQVEAPDNGELPALSLRKP